MLDRIKRLTKHSIVYGISHIATRGVGFLLLPIHTNAFSRGEYGIAAVVFTFLAIAIDVYSLGVPSAFLRQYLLSDGKAERQRVYSTAFWSVLALAAGFTLVLELGAGPVARWLLQDARHADLIRLSGGILFFDSVNILSFLLLRAEEKSVSFAVFQLANVLITFVLNALLILKLGMGVEGIFLANLFASGATFLLLLPVSLRRLSLRFSVPTLRFLLRFGLPYLPSTIAVVLMDVIDRVILQRLAGNEVTGLYSAGYKLGMFMALFVAAFRFAWHPFFLSEVKKEGAKELFARVLTYLLLACLTVYLLICFVVDDIVRFQILGFTLFGPQYWESTPVVPWVMLAYIFYAAYLNFVIGIYTEARSEYLPLVTGIGAAVNIAANFLLIPRFGMMGSAYATTLGYAAMALALFVVGQRLYPVRYEYRRIVHMGVVAGFLFALERQFHPQLSFPVRLAMALSYPLLLYVSGFFDGRERAGIRRALRRVTWPA
ncbi:MAG: oligosaccharide flippase family protein [candidate division KSB1 bacterium]|nr:oligosaccharide flippase family protein [candidate division KSB1 bacterium]